MAILKINCWTYNFLVELEDVYYDAALLTL